MRLDYHMHFERGSYDYEWVRGFFDAASAREIDEIGITEHSHTFPEFRALYEASLTLDDSFVGTFQKKWLYDNKFKYSIGDYLDFMETLRARGHKVLTAMEVCNFPAQDEVRAVLAPYDFDYLIGSVHFVDGWGFDASAVQEEFDRRDLADIYDTYATEAENLCASGIYDVMGHPFNLRVFKRLPDFDVTPYLERVARALQKADMAVDINTGTLYRYPIAEISPYPDFLAVAAAYHLPIITSSDAHEPKDCGAHIEDAIAYAKSFGYTKQVRFHRRDRALVPLG